MGPCILAFLIMSLNYYIDFLWDFTCMWYFKFPLQGILNSTYYAIYICYFSIIDEILVPNLFYSIIYSWFVLKKSSGLLGLVHSYIIIRQHYALFGYLPDYLPLEKEFFY